MIQRVVLCVLCMFVLSACDAGGDSAPAVITNNDSYVPFDVENTSTSATGMIISGAINHNTGEVLAFSLPLDRQQGAYRHVEIETRNGYILRLFHRVGIPAGTYPITTTLDTTPPDTEFGAGLLFLWSPDPADQFTSNPQGTVTIDYDNENILGSFTVTAENVAGESVEIVGQFYTQDTISVLR